MSTNKQENHTSFKAAQRMETLLPNHSEDLEGDALTDLDHIAPPARPLAEGTDVDSSNTSWEQVNGSGSGGSYVQCRGVEDEAGGNLTSGPSHTRADATAADMPSPAQADGLVEPDAMPAGWPRRPPNEQHRPPRGCGRPGVEVERGPCKEFASLRF